MISEPTEKKMAYLADLIDQHGPLYARFVQILGHPPVSAKEVSITIDLLTGHRRSIRYYRKRRELGKPLF